MVQLFQLVSYFENATKDFKNDYRFMNAEIINEKLKTVKFKGASWDVEVQPNYGGDPKDLSYRQLLMQKKLCLL